MSQKNTIVWGIVILALVLGLFSVFSDKGSDEGPIKIGVIASLTGKGASRGESVIQGLTLAMEELEEAGIIKKGEIELVYQDVPLDKAKDGPVAVSRLVDAEKVSAIIGPMGSAVVLASVPTIEERKVPSIVHAASTLGATKNNDYVFRLWPTAYSYADVIVKEAKKRGYKRIGALSATYDNTIELIDILKDDLKKEGIEIVIDERVSTDVKDFRTQLAKIKGKNIDALFLNLFEGQTGVAGIQARELEIKGSIFTNSVTSEVELQGGGDKALEGAWYPIFSAYTEKGENKFVNRFGKEPSNPDSASASHDALIALGRAIRDIGGDPEKIKDYLYSNKFEGSTGDFNFRESGDANISIQLLVVKDGQIVSLE